MSEYFQTGFVFPGQGSQYVGMGKDLYESFPRIKELYDAAEELLEFPLKKISFEGPEEELKQTRYTQPAIFVLSMAVKLLLDEMDISPDATAGHSLGEYSALVAADALTWEDALKLVKIRGELMQRSGENNPGTMAAIIGLSDEMVKEICLDASADGIVQPANFNSPGQIVISGSVAGVHRAMDIAKDRKARMVTELTVSGAFHSPLMEEAIGGLSEALENTPLSDPQIPVYTNVTAQPAKTSSEVRELLNRQLMAPVLWQNIVENMVGSGIRKFYETGPSKVLSGLHKRIHRDVPCTPVGSVNDLESLKKEMN